MGPYDGDREENIRDILQKMRSTRRKRHVENIQIAVATLIIGSFFSRAARSLWNSSSNLADLSKVVAAITGVFLLAKLTEVTTRQFRPEWAETTLLTDFLSGAFILAIGGFAILFGLQLVGVSPTLTQLLLLVSIGIVLIAGFLITVMSYWHRKTGFGLLDLGIVREEIRGIESAAREQFSKTLFQNPYLVDEELEMIDYHTPVQTPHTQESVLIDIVAENWNEDLFALMTATSDYQPTKEDLDLAFEVVTGGVTIVTNGELSEKQRRELDATVENEEFYGITEIDKYTIFGRFSGFIERVDQSFGILPPEKLYMKAEILADAVKGRLPW